MQPPQRAVVPAASDAALPIQLTRLIGREREIATVRQLLGTTRLLTLTGAGGSGKTRLALEVAATLAAEHPGGPAWVELAALSDPGLLPQQLAATLGLREEGGRSTREVLLDALRGRSLLLVLDNCEHLADACAALVETLLRGCPELHVLATSREALGVAGERAWLVPPLSLPDAGAPAEPEQLAGFEAVQLFVERAQDVLPAFVLTEQNAAAVAQICRRLDGIPLAIELAAARVKVLTPEQIAQRLDNAFALLTSGSRTAVPRHRTLRATIDWSYQLLSEPERNLLQRLSIFSGGLTLEAAEAICADERLDAWEVLDLLARLADRSMVVMREQEGVARYHLLETVRQYARGMLEREGEGEVFRRRHAAYFLAFAETAAPHLYLGGSDPRWFTRVGAEIGNLRAAADWFENDAEGTDAALRLAAALFWFWYQRDNAGSRKRLEVALERTDGHSLVARARALVALSATAWMQGDVPSMQTPLAWAIPILRSHGEQRALTEALNWAAMRMSAAGETEEARKTVEEGLILARAIGGPLQAHLVGTAGFLALRRGELVPARNFFQECLQLARELSLLEPLENMPLLLGRVAYVQGDLVGAAAYFRESLATRSYLSQRWGLPIALEGLALVTAAEGDRTRAARLLGAAAGIRERMGTKLELWPEDRLVIDGLIAAGKDASVDAGYAEGQMLNGEQAIGLALADGTSEAPAAASTTMATTLTTPVVGSRSSSSAAVPALHVLALGPLETYREGELLPADAWRHNKPKELLLYLLVHPEGRTREQIGLQFWPDSSAAQVKNSFHVALHHLRKVLGRSEWIMLENERYRINPELGVEFDVALFERQLSAALREVRAGAESVERLRSALDLYRGDFLQNETVGDWHLEIREHLSRLYIEGLSALGGLLMQNEEYAEAAEVYQQIVRKEDLQEEAHRRLILCLARAGERAKALRHYERLVALLREELGAEPEEVTTELYERLRQAEMV